MLSYIIVFAQDVWYNDSQVYVHRLFFERNKPIWTAYIKERLIYLKYSIPEGYKSPLSLFETQLAIKDVKDYFQNSLSSALHLRRVTAPLFVRPETGLNDNLNGIERPVAFGIREQSDTNVEIVQSLAKWKRYALKKYGFQYGTGLYTDMNAIRRDEDTDAIHSIYVDQWDWEKIISREERSLETLKKVVSRIYGCLYATEAHILSEYPVLGKSYLPNEITFVTSQELEDVFPDLTPAEREYQAVKRHGAIFVIGIGAALKSGKRHDKRAPDYDDWSLNGDIILYNRLLDRSFEISSMGIRVDAERLSAQLKILGLEERSGLPFQAALLNDELPLTIGGGIGQSRLCMFFLRKAHIGEVQCSVWREDTILECEKAVNQPFITYILISLTFQLRRTFDEIHKNARCGQRLRLHQRLRRNNQFAGRSIHPSQ